MNESIVRFVEDINNKINYYRKEYLLTYAEVIGVLEIIQMSLYEEAKEDDES